MTEPLTPEEQLEWRARVEHLITDRILKSTDNEMRRDIRLAPHTLLAAGIGSGAALMVAATAVAAAVLKWLHG